MSNENQVKRPRMNNYNKSSFFIREYKAPIRTIVASTSTFIPDVSFVNRKKKFWLKN